MRIAAGVILIITGVTSVAVPYKVATMMALARADSYQEYLNLVSSLARSPWATSMSVILVGVIIGGGVCALRKKAYGLAFAGAVCSAIAMGFYALMFAAPGLLAAIFLLLRRREFKMATYDKAIKSDSGNAGPYYDRGEAYTEMAEYDRAIADYSKAIELDPRHALAFFNRAHAYGETGDYDKAVADYTKAIELVPADAQAYYNRGLDYLNQGEVHLAVSDLEKAVELSTDPELTHDAEQALHKLRSAS